MQLCRSGLSANQSLDYTLARNATITTAPSFLSARLLVSNSMALQAAQFATIFLSTGPTCSKKYAIFDDELDPNPGAKHSSNKEPINTIAASSSNGKIYIEHCSQAVAASIKCRYAALILASKSFRALKHTTYANQRPTNGSKRPKCSLRLTSRATD
jgi:hypothetical protein